MYHVKQQGHDGWAIYQPEMEAIVTTAPAFLQGLSQALARNEFELWYLRVVAEGIETPEQERLLTQMGCGVLQGFLYAQPLPAQQILALLQRDSLIKQLSAVSCLPQQRSVSR
ncbi:EAL domain-containing protein [Citrobacter amalonaticus]|nr:EAL domain-containing protein [Citrobacter amalonaticus]